jgi:hypothetical protein
LNLWLLLQDGFIGCHRIRGSALTIEVTELRICPIKIRDTVNPNRSTNYCRIATPLSSSAMQWSGYCQVAARET